MLTAYGPIVIMIVLFYVLLYRPQQAEQKRRAEMLSTLHRGNKVVTRGGIYGEIVSLKEDVVELQIADKVVIKVKRGAIGQNLTQGKSADGEPSGKDEKPDA